MQETDQNRFFVCLRLIIERAQEFGGQLFFQAAYTLTELIHYDPNVYPLVAKSGLPDAVIASLKARSHFQGPFKLSGSSAASVTIYLKFAYLGGEITIENSRITGFFKALIACVYGKPLEALGRCPRAGQGRLVKDA